MFRRILSLALLLMLCVSIAAAQERRPVMSGFEEEETYRDWASNLFFKRMEERSGISFDYRQIGNAADWEEYKARLLNPGVDLPDVLFKANLNPSETILMLDAGVLLDLAPLVPLYAPNLNRLLEEHPDVRGMIVLPGGRIGALPFINLAPTQNAMWVNKLWLEELKLQLPRNAQEFADMLRVFLSGDPNLNLRNDEIPMAFLGSYDLKYLAHAFGLIANDYNIFAREGRAVFMPLEPEYRDFVLWLSQLKKEGLLDKEGFTTHDNLRRVDDNKAAQRYGVFFAPLPSVFLPADWAQDYVLLPPLSYGDEQRYRRVAPRATPGTFALTSACQEPGKLLTWVDYLYTPQGAVLATNGQEGTDYLVDGDGTWRITQSAQQSGFLAASTIGTGSMPPGVSSHGFQARSSQAAVRHVIQELNVLDAIASDPFPPYSLTRAQEEVIAPLQRQIGRYVDESLARFVIGEWTADEAGFAAFEMGLKERGIDQFMAFWQNVLDQQGRADD